MDEKNFVNSLSERNISLNNNQLDQFHRYFELLVEWNEKVNLTAITKKNDVYLKHFFDSITPSFYFDFNKLLNLCDVGAGAGFPSIPLLICFPQMKVTIIDSLKKRITFLEKLIDELNLKDVTLIHGRAEEIGRQKNHREQYDVVTARAVARTNVLSEYCLPLVKNGGHFIALKGSYLEDEEKESKNAIKKLGGQLKDRYEFKLPIENSDRNILIIRKISKTAKTYPRKAGTPSKRPIT